MTQDHPAVDGSALCTACGLCCDGTLFHRANSKPEEEPILIAQGMEVVQTPRGPKFALPCHHLQGTRCGIYGERFRTDLLPAGPSFIVRALGVDSWSLASVVAVGRRSL
jgi:hypothetical protein